MTWYPGQADGEALADVLYGDVDPAFPSAVELLVEVGPDYSSRQLCAGVQPSSSSAFERSTIPSVPSNVVRTSAFG